ncbi:hypothetical protein Bca4012_019776 [Brassica carinata]
MRDDSKVVVATNINPKMVGGRLFLNATSGTHIYFESEQMQGSLPSTNWWLGTLVFQLLRHC